MADENGRWVTINGTHIFIKDGQTLEQAMAERFDESDWQDESEPTFDDYDIKPDLDIEEFKQTNSKKLFRGVLDASYKETKERLKLQYNQHPVINPELEGVIADVIAKRMNVRKIWAKDEYTGGGTYYSRWKRQIVMNTTYNDGEYQKTMDNLFHESGHALDNNSDNEYSSYKYVSKKYNTTLTNMLKQEISSIDIDAVIKECERLQDLRRQVGDLRDAGQMDKYEARNERFRLNRARLSIIDVIQGTFGYDFVMDKFNTWTHQKGYFGNGGQYDNSLTQSNRGTEFFAEMTCDLCVDKEHNFSNFMKTLAPKSVDIFYEIMEDKYGYKQNKR